MVDVTDKIETKREATAYGQIKLKESTLKMIKNGQIEKGAVLETARVAGIMGVKKTSDLIPMCHPLPITGIDIKFEFENSTTLGIYATVRMTGKTGVEMEAFTGVSIAALTIYDMCKAVDKNMVIKNIKLMKKMGGKSGTYVREKY
jgi:cyclic pyranopterin phosphate synthase